MITPVTCDTLGQLDGGAARAIIDAAIRDAIRDLDDRGEDDKPRKVEIVLTLTRREDAGVECTVEAAARVPRRRTASVVGRLRRSGAESQLLFQEWDNEAPDQTTIDDHVKEGE